jgi:paraquat-inducible protein B
MKVSELGTNIDGIKAKITKIADEQQKRYDEIMVKLQAALDALANSDADVPADVTAKLDEVNTLLTAFDDTIPETATPPVA